ncbi:MAG: DUF5335 domain-containing protein [Chloroflexi bacterium]|nr:DUF5335 domain-containing protein [Chloroflexota bacterium]
MARQEVMHEQWSQFLDNFSRQHEGWLATLEITGPNVGNKIETKDLPFRGITYDLKGSSRNNVSIFMAINDQEDETHTITNPSHIRFASDQGIDRELELESGDGDRAILRFTHPIRSESVDRL